MSTRKYTSEVRAEAARETRRRILQSAELEVATAGYHAMTIASLARRADVSPQTIYNAIGSKAAVIKSLYDVLLAGDDEPVPMARRSAFLAVLQQPDALATIRAYLALGGIYHLRVGALLAGVIGDGPGGDVELKAFVETIEAERRAGNASIVAHLDDQFGLPAGRSVEWVTDVFWAVTSFELIDRLVRRCGWGVPEYERWAAEVIISSVWGPETVAGSSR